MKNIFVCLCFLTSFAFAQNTVSDIDGNSYDYLTYGSQQWTVVHAAMEAYRDGTPIPQVTDPTEWNNLTSGAWRYGVIDSSQGKLYNWYAVMGIHDNDESTPDKEFAPQGWHVPSDTEWTTLEEHLIANGYNYDGTTTENKIAKSMASTSGWDSSIETGSVGNNPSTNNTSEFNGFPNGAIVESGGYDTTSHSVFWTSTEDAQSILKSWNRSLTFNADDLGRNIYNKTFGFSVRFVQDSDSCSEASINASSTEVCNGESIDLSVVSTSSGEPTACSSAGFSVNLQNGLVGYWPFCGNANDESGSGNNGSVYNVNITTDRFSNPGQAYSFSNSQQSMVTINPSASLSITNDITFSAWFYPTDQTPGYIVDRDVCGFSNDWGLQWLNGQVKMRTQNNEDQIVSGILPINNWYHVVVVKQSDVFTMYINNSIHSQGSGFNYNFTNTSNPVRIGDQSCSDTAPNFDGKIDDVGIWNRALTITEITNLYEQTNITNQDYTWSTGDTTENISVTPSETTEYWVDVTTNGVTCREYITISVTAPAAPTGDAEQTFCDAATVADLTATGENIQWYDAATYGNLLDATAALTDGQVVYASSTNEININNGIDLSYNNWNIPINGGGGAEPSDSSLGEHHAIINDQFGLWDDYEESTNLKHLMESNNDLGIISGYDYLGIYNSSFYYRSQTLSGWNDAKNTASQAGGWLATFESLEENNFVSELNVVAGFEQVWIGLFQDLNDDNYIEPDGAWKWLNTITCIGSRLMVTVTIQDINITASETEVCAGDSVDLSILTVDVDVEYFNWDVGEPNDTNGIENVVHIQPSGKWNDNASESYPTNAIFELNYEVSELGNSIFLGNYNNHSYFYENQPLNWLEANQMADSYNAYLLNINTAEENEFIVNSVNNLGLVLDAWLGMIQDENDESYSEPSGGWKWLNSNYLNPEDYSNLWSTGDTTETISVTPIETTEYWVDVTTNGVTCREYITIGVTSPAAPTGNPVQGGCSDFTVGSNNNAFTGENLQWYANPSGGTAIPDNHLLVDGTYYYISQTVDGCESTDRFEFQYLAPEPTITIVSPLICEGESATVSVTSSPFVGTATFLWNTGETSETITLSPTESTSYWVDQVYNSGSPENIQTVCRYFFGVAVDQAPDSPISGGDITECETIAAQNLVATVTANTGQTIIWYDALTSGGVVSDPSLNTAGTVTYYAETISDSSGCPSLSRTAVTLTITSVAAPTGDAVQSFCDSVVISDLAVTGDDIQWYDSATGGTLLDDTTVLIDGQLVYASQTLDSCESLDRLGVSVEIDIITDPILITTELDFCLAREATLADLEIDAQGFELEWYDSYTGGTLLGLDTILEDAISYYATLYDVVSGCESLMRLEVIPAVIPCEVIIYNAISLNDNGLNDYMVIENAEYFPLNTLEIFNRDGYLVYNQRKYGVGDNLFRGMANVGGIYSKGSNLPTGSYLYVFTYYNPYEQQEFVKKGFLTINNN